MVWARSLGLQLVIIEIDAKRVKDAFLRQGREDTPFGNYIIARKKFLSDFLNISVNWMSRNANMVAHSLTRAARHYESPYYWVEPPKFVDDLLDICHSCM